MSHSVGPSTGGASGAGSEHSDPGSASILDVVKVFARLLPKQLKDEAQLAKLELTEKAKTLGKGARYPEIFEANRPMLSDPDKIYPGQVLRIPAK